MTPATEKCPRCGGLMVEQVRYKTPDQTRADMKCAKCGHTIPGY